ncbi:unnamed protein product [Rotaria sp. Silwood1]|nr:unnamed protein product [Rotaria sp. Silwood1]CAF5141095.1 unnamed protein product [Rotaria sp. Silwood1]
MSNINDNDIEELNENNIQIKNCLERKDKLNDISYNYSNYSDQYHSKTNSLIVKEISNPNYDDTSSLSSLTTVTNKGHQTSNGLIVTSSKHVHL